MQRETGGLPEVTHRDGREAAAVLRGSDDGERRGPQSSMRARGDRGQSLVEFALVVPLLLILIVGIAEFGRAWMTRNILTGAAREAVRIAVVAPPAGSQALATARANQILSAANISGAGVSINDDGTPFGTITVTVNYTFPLTVLGFVPGLNSDIPLSSTTTMRKEF